MNTYECVICLNTNHNSKLHCSCCGAVPAKYSPIGVTARNYYGEFADVLSERINPWITVVVAHGADRAEHHKTSRSTMRTVKADYYADC